MIYVYTVYEISKNLYICIHTQVYDNCIFCIYSVYIYMLSIQFMYIAYIHIDTQGWSSCKGEINLYIRFLLVNAGTTKWSAHIVILHTTKCSYNRMFHAVIIG